jgi:hypothetical protein
MLLATARLHHVNAAAAMDAWRTVALLAELPTKGGDVAWSDAQVLAGEPALASGPAAGAGFQPLPACAARAASYKTWRKEVASHFQSASALTVWRCPDLKETSRPDESEGDFRARLAHAFRERRDDEKEGLRQRFAPKLAALEEQVRQAAGRVEREKSQYTQQTAQAAISVGATVLGALFGRKIASVGNLGRGTTAMRAGARAMREREDIGRAQEGVEAKRQRLEELQAEFDAATKELETAPDPASLRLETVSVAPRKGDLSVTRLALAWARGCARGPTCRLGGRGRSCVRRVRVWGRAAIAPGQQGPSEQVVPSSLTTLNVVALFGFGTTEPVLPQYSSPPLTLKFVA